MYRLKLFAYWFNAEDAGFRGDYVEAMRWMNRTEKLKAARKEKSRKE